MNLASNIQIMNILNVLEYDGEGLDSGKRIMGNELIGYANDIMADIQHRIGGGIIYLDCEDKQHLKNFYIERNHYKIFGERISNSDNIRYLQMIRFF